MIIIGSTAIKEYYPDFNREPKDLDYAIESDDKKEVLTSTKRVEYLLNPVLFKYSTSRFLEPDLLLTLKMSHLFWDINWEKHMFDVQFLLSKGLKYNKELFYELYEYWNKVHGANHRSDLKMSKADFFDNALKKYDHDHLHTLINPNPTYVSMLADGEEVDIAESKFNNASHEDKINLIREEVYVMGFERFGKLNYRTAYGRMFKKYLFSHAPLYVAIFAIENYMELLKPTHNFIKQIEEQL